MYFIVIYNNFEYIEFCYDYEINEVRVIKIK